MSSWHVTPEYINDHWTEEQFLLLFRMRNKRIMHESGNAPKPSTSKLSDDAFFRASGIVPITVVEDKE